MQYSCLKCGGKLVANAAKTCGKCQSCGTVWTVNQITQAFMEAAVIAQELAEEDEDWDE